MARITDEKIVQINELYAEIGVKSRVAKIVGCSPATVTKYLIEGYIPIAKRKKIVFEKEYIKNTGSDFFIEEFKNSADIEKTFSEICSLSALEMNELKALKKIVYESEE